jgi:DNA-binding CsgD family transcriptional regulator
MSLWHRLLYRLGLRRDDGPHSYTLEAPLNTSLLSLAEQQGRSPEELAADLVTTGLAQQHTADDLVQRWDSLSPREQQVAALACLGYTNRQMAAQLGISDETVKTHLHNALIKFNLHGRSELRMLLANWDFSGGWDRQ